MSAELEGRLQDMRDALTQQGVNLTSRRSKLLEILVSSERHPTAAEIHQELRRYYPGTSLATVYNTLELLKETGQVLEIEFSGSPNRYDGRRVESHPHLVCVECHRIDDLDSIELDEPLDSIATTTGYQITRHRIDYYGVCPQCQAKG
ncbi:MAG: transcriptional repressor [Chloroflexi bacterium]|nr:transcriptional repressor [Chloroflexota bacterium]